MKSLDYEKELKAIVLIQSCYRCYCLRKLYSIAYNNYEQICNDIENEIRNDIPNYESYKYGKYANRIDKVGDIFLFEVIHEAKSQDNDNKENLFNENTTQQTADNTTQEAADNNLNTTIAGDADAGVTSKFDDDIINRNIDNIDSVNNINNIDNVDNVDNDDNADNIDNIDNIDNVDNIVLHKAEYADDDIVFRNIDNIDNLMKNKEMNINTSNINSETINNYNDNINNDKTNTNDDDDVNNSIPSEIKLALLKAEERFLKQSLIDRIKLLKNKNS
jgi:hypothetical protein